jgi:hypothetical protein
MLVLLHQPDKGRIQNMAKIPDKPSPGFKKPAIGKPSKTKPGNTKPKPPRDKPKG